jgi:hypothetical protein
VFDYRREEVNEHRQVGLRVSDQQIFILEQDGSKNPLYTAWSQGLSTPCTFVEQYTVDWVPPPVCALLVTTQQYRELEFSILQRAMAKDIPILIITDGILEYRNTWLHPGMAPGAIFQPVVGHKIACLGRSQARILESWGNLGKCEIIGAPRLDPLIGKQPRKRNPGESFRLLIMTARTPGFTPDQIVLTKRSMRDLKFWLSQHQNLSGTRVEPVWRLTQDLDKEIGVENLLTELSGQELAEILQNVDAVITTPSTTMLEAMLHGLPVALLDYNNCPHYVPAAWTISAPRHIDTVLPELFDPPAAKMLYQDTILHDALESRTPATTRMLKLVEEMIAIGQWSRAQNKPLNFPRRMLIDDQDSHHFPEERFDMKALYPGHSVFAEMDRVILQVQTEHLKQEVYTLRKMLKVDNFFKELSKSFPGPRKLSRLWRESRQKPHG